MGITAEIKDVKVSGQIIYVTVAFSDGTTRALEYSENATAEDIMNNIAFHLKEKNKVNQIALSFEAFVGSTVAIKDIATEEIELTGKLKEAVDAIVAARPPVEP